LVLTKTILTIPTAFTAETYFCRLNIIFNEQC
jgi:hypothetical protein